jgi:hypothetical protein
VRLHLPGWVAGGVDPVEDRLRRIQGVESVQANRWTENVLIHFDRSVTDEHKLLADLREAWAGLNGAPRWTPAVRQHLRRPVERPSASPPSWLRVGMRGLLGHAAVDSLWFAAGFLGESLGLPLAGLGPLHVLLDLGVWGLALRSGTRRHHAPPPGNGTPRAVPAREQYS